MGPFVEGYRARLLELGYTPGSTKHQLRWLGQLGRWMDGESLEARALDGDAIEAFFADRRVHGHVRVPSPRRLRSLVDYLRDAGVIAAEHREHDLTPLDELVGEYGRGWLSSEDWRRRRCFATRPWRDGSSASESRRGTSGARRT
jgi:hypothetical protein